MAITDHGALYGAVAFYQAAKTKGIKPIIGVETYVARRSMTDKEGKADSQPFHLILLAKDYRGYQNLCRLVTDAHIDGYYYKPRIDREHLAKYSEGLIGLQRVPRRRGRQGARGRRLGAGPQRRRRVRRHLRQGRLLPGAPGPRPARAAPAQRAAPAARPGGRPAAGRHQRPPLRPPGPVRGARRPAVRRDRQQPRHARPPEVRDPRVLREVGGPDGGALPGPARGDPQQPAHRRDDRHRAAARPAAHPALPGARRPHRRELAARGVPGAASSAATGRSRRSSRSGSTTSSA